MNQNYNSFSLLSYHRFNKPTMQQLLSITKQRYSRMGQNATQVTELSTNKFQQLKQQQKQRCEKQTWVLSIMRTKTAQFLNLQQKKILYTNSYEIMRIIDPDFTLSQSASYDFYEQLCLPENTEKGQFKLRNQDEIFLNSFVCLYTRFFDRYADKLSFKTKINSLLRPTNRNVVIDLVRYLIDFSRDYCQYLIYMEIRKQQHRKSMKQPQITDQHKTKDKVQIATNFKQLTPNNQIKQKPTMYQMRNSKSNETHRNSHSNIKPIIVTNNTNEQQSDPTTKQQLKTLYKILDVQLFPKFVYANKTNKGHLQLIKLKMNEMYRDAKLRNNLIKQSIALYYTTRNMQTNSNGLSGNIKQVIEDDNTINCQPFQVSIVIERNGFSCLNLTLMEDQKILPGSERGGDWSYERNHERTIDRVNDGSCDQTNDRASDRSYKQIRDRQQRFLRFSTKPVTNPTNMKNTRNDFLLNSLKILKVSQNKLPPLNNDSGYFSQNCYRKSQQFRVNSASSTNTNNNQQTTYPYKSLIKSNEYLLNSLQANRTNSRNQNINLNTFNYNQTSNQEQVIEIQMNRQRKKKIHEMRVHFASKERIEQNRKIFKDPQEKIVEWLDKINLMKQIERRKLLGLD